MCKDLVQEYRIWLQELLEVLRVVCEEVVPAGRFQEDIYWKTKALCENIGNLEQKEAEAELFQYAADGRCLLNAVRECLDSAQADGNPVSEEACICLRRIHANAILNSLQMLVNFAGLTERHLHCAEEIKQCSDRCDTLSQYFEIDETEEVKRIRSGVVVKQKKQIAKTYHFCTQKAENWKSSVAG